MAEKTRGNLEPLTPEEQAFASDNHDIVFKYLAFNKLNRNEWYDVVIFRYLRSVQRWFREPQLHVHNFEIIAFYAMRSAVGHEREKRRRQEDALGTILSLDACVKDTEGVTLVDCVTEQNKIFA